MDQPWHAGNEGLMEYRSLSDLQRAIVAHAWKIPPDVDLIVGVPRSGLLAANLLALHLNLPLADLDGLLEGRVLSGGERARAREAALPAAARRILVLDDSLASGSAMTRARARVAASALADRVLFGAVFVTPGGAAQVDVVFETCETPRFFEWNFMHHSSLAHACVDIDGVLCRDPSEEENDDGERYLTFLRDATPLHIPTVPVATLVTCRLEKYREATTDWLERHGVQYGALVMWDLASKEERLRSGGHAQFKAQAYRAGHCRIFIESSLHQAPTIADLSGRPVFCVEVGATFFPDAGALAGVAARRVARAVVNRAGFARTTLGRWLNWLANS